MTEPLDLVQQSEDETLDLLRQAVAGDQEAWRKLYASHQALMRAVMRNRIPIEMRARFDTEDVMQSAFLELSQRRATIDLRDARSFRHWLARVLLNKLRDRIRHAAAAMRDANKETRPPTELLNERPGAGPIVDEIVARAELQARMLEEIDALPPQDQEIVTARFLEQRPWAEVARITGLAVPTCQHRATDILERMVRRFL